MDFFVGLNIFTLLFVTATVFWYKKMCRESCKL